MISRDNRSGKQSQRHVLITGATQGIGRAIVDYFVSCGDQIYVFDIKPDSDESVESLRQMGVGYHQVDVGSVASIEAGFVWCDKLLANRSATLDILINNAGVINDRLSLRITEADWDRVLDINLKGAFFCAQQTLKRMIKIKTEAARYIVMMSSVVALTGNSGQAHYAASKAGLIALTKSLAREYASRRILINAVAPGYVATTMTAHFSEELVHQMKSMIPLGRQATAAEIAQSVAFLTSGNADYITGQVLNVNGGLVMI